MEFAQLFPDPAGIEIEAYVQGLGFSQRAPDDRPFVVVNFVSSVDGRATVAGHSGGLGDAGDKALFHALRWEVDAVLAGTGTLAAERYGRMIGDPEVRERRRRRGLSPEPLACTVTRRGLLPLDIPLFAEPEAKVVVFTGRAVDLTGVRAQVEVVEMVSDEMSFGAALAHLRAHHGVRTLLCEGGPRVFGELAGERVYDQLFLTFSRKLAGGGSAPAITSGPALDEPQSLTLEGVLERQGTLFLRYSAPH
jgi:riboflavin biosynthesis pyrimidine reductase